MDPRGVITSYAYDALNRNTTVMYTNDAAATPAITRSYDGAIRGKGRLWKTETAGVKGSRSTMENYDPLGRPQSLTQQFKRTSVSWSPSYNIQRIYDLAGHILTQTYPSGHTVNYNYDTAGRLADFVAESQNPLEVAFSGNLGDGVTRNYISGVNYDNAGRLQEERYGTLTPLYHKQRFKWMASIYCRGYSDEA